MNDNPQPSDDQIREALSGNFCRCTGYQGIVAAARRAAEVIGHTEAEGASLR
ncbi:[2Fe-2S] binding domain protein [Mycobacterium kansasii]|uniref:[2Fe-2S] binding domain protein n=1 Tax=Mycobacterium kansasii TaxID=1768 RepID=A0A1V3WR03_MYCKA|nr:[2Fe-2S] binding domain protein [Mycobacterium kansasii]